MSDPPATNRQIKRIVCPDCDKTFAPDGFTTRPVDGHPGLSNVGLSCPYCHWFGHCFIEDMRVRRRRATVDLRRRDFNRKRTPGKWNQVVKAQAELERVFDETQAKWRPALGLVPVWQVDTAAASVVE